MLIRGFQVGTLSCLLIFNLISAGHAQGPKGEFLCQQQQSGGPAMGSGYYTTVAHMQLNPDGSFSAKDVTTSVPEVHGHFTYDAKAKTLQWDSGIWKTLLGHYIPNFSPTPVFLVTTKKDPAGRVDGTFRCVRVSK